MKLLVVFHKNEFTTLNFHKIKQLKITLKKLTLSAAARFKNCRLIFRI